MKHSLKRIIIGILLVLAIGFVYASSRTVPSRSLHTIRRLETRAGRLQPTH